MRPQVTYWQQEALALQAQEQQVRQHLERMVSSQLPVGVGALSWIILQLYRLPKVISEKSGGFPGEKRPFHPLFRKGLLADAIEIRGWDRFQNRRRIASYTGLCPGTPQS